MDDSAAYQRQWRADHPGYMSQYRTDHPDYIKRHKAAQRKRAARNQDWLFNYLLEHPCVDCGEADPVVLEFDHIGNDKKWDVAGMYLFSIKRIQEEIAKCEVVCANCH